MVKIAAEETKLRLHYKSMTTMGQRTTMQRISLRVLLRPEIYFTKIYYIPGIISVAPASPELSTVAVFVGCV